MTRQAAFLMGAIVLAASVASGADFYADCLQEPSSTIFVSGFQRFARLKNGDGYVRTRYNPTAGALGYVYRTGPWYAGASFSYEQGDRKYDFVGGQSAKIRSYNPGFTLFGGWTNPEGWYAKGSAFLGFNSLKSRSIYDGTAGQPYSGSSEHNLQFGASIEAGKAFDIGNSLVLKPHAGFDYARSPSEWYTYGGVPGVFGSGAQNFYEIPIGVSLSRTFNCGNWAVTPEVDVTLVNSLGGMNENYFPGFASRTADEWKVYGIGGDHIGGRVRAGVNAKLNNRTTMGLDYTFEGRKDYQDHRISAMLGWSF